MNERRKFERPYDPDKAFAREKARLDREEIFYYALSVAFFLLALIVYTFPSVKMVHLVYQEHKVKDAEKALKSEQTRLRLKYEMMNSPEEMEKRATQAGFAPVRRERVIYVDKK
jgi:flagellar biosynthesis/type III secretory pathway M-ring protein FliF/YscJ